MINDWDRPKTFSKNTGETLSRSPSLALCFFSLFLKKSDSPSATSHPIPLFCEEKPSEVTTGPLLLKRSVCVRACVRECVSVGCFDRLDWCVAFAARTHTYKMAALLWICRLTVWCHSVTLRSHMVTACVCVCVCVRAGAGSREVYTVEFPLLKALQPVPVPSPLLSSPWVLFL